MPDPDKLTSVSRVLAGCPDAVVLMNSDATIAWWNAAASEMFGYSLAQVIGHNVDLLMPEPFRSAQDAYMERLGRDGEAGITGSSRALYARRCNGEFFPVELSITPLGALDRARYGAFIRDLSERQDGQPEWCERERLAVLGLGALVFAHEVGNLLNNMALQAQLVERGLREQRSAWASRAGAVVAEVRRFSELLDEFRTLGRRQVLEVAPIDMPKLMREVAGMKLQPGRCSEVVIECQVQKGDERATVHGDRDKLKQVLVNLCKNALEAMPDGGRLALSTHRGEGALRLVVEDTAGGLPIGVDVFQPFQSTKEGGFGLGLPIARQIVKAHGGSLRCESSPGLGTRFIVELPASGFEASPKR